MNGSLLLDQNLCLSIHHLMPSVYLCNTCPAQHVCGAGFFFYFVIEVWTVHLMKYVPSCPQPGLHRELGVHLSKVRSLKMDTKVWTPALIQLMQELGNRRSNAFWEASLNEEEKVVPDDTL